MEHPKEDYVTGMRQPVKDLRLGMPLGHFDALQPDVQKAVMEAIGLLGTMTKGVKDMTLPPIGPAADLDSELLAFHEPYFKEQPGKYMASVRRSLAAETAANIRAVITSARCGYSRNCGARWTIPSPMSILWCSRRRVWWRRRSKNS